jgi:excisionase family DNA binding protein
MDIRDRPICRRPGAGLMQAEQIDTDSPRMLSPEDVARVCGLSRRAVYRAISRGELRAARLCSRLRVDPDELERWKSAHTLAPPVPRAAPVRPAHAAAFGSLRAMLDQAPNAEDGNR